MTLPPILLSHTLGKGVRLGLGILGALPLLIPLELSRGQWPPDLSTPGTLVLTVGSFLATGLLFYASVVGPTEAWTIDEGGLKVVVQALGLRHTRQLLAKDIALVSLEKQVWASAPPTFVVVVKAEGGRVFRHPSGLEERAAEVLLRQIRERWHATAGNVGTY